MYEREYSLHYSLMKIALKEFFVRLIAPNPNKNRSKSIGILNNPNKKHRHKISRYIRSGLQSLAMD